MNKKLVLASFNQGKRREIAALLPGIELLSPADFGMKELPPESGSTFLENALIKAVSVAGLSGLPAAGDDSGLEVDALGGAPGVISARYAGPEHDDAANNRKLLAELAGVADRTARFVCTVALVFPYRVDAVADDQSGAGFVHRLAAHPLLPEGFTGFVSMGAVAGLIVDDARGSDGFGYDPIFFRPDLGLTFAEIPGSLKNELSHRGQAFRALVPLLSKLGGQGR